jgi:NADH-quinone oxidoreductase subunit H
MGQQLLFESVKISCVVLGLLGIVAYTVLLERRVAAWMQDRTGPNRVGPQGLLQPIADFMKLFLKEDILPDFVNKPYYLLAPALVIVPALLSIAVIPWGSMLGKTKCVIADLDVGLLYVFAVSSFTVYGIVLAGWSSNSKYAFLGGIRSSAQMISYEVCLGLSVAGLLLQTGTMNLGEIVVHQAQHGWLVLTQPIGFFVFLVSAFAETNRLPFDFPEAEQELVGGYHTEYSSMKFALFFMGEYANMTVSSALMATLFFGGWSLPFAPFNAPAQTLGVGLAHIGVFLAKLLFFLLFFIGVRWTLPSFRYDQLMRLGWNVMLPLALANLLATAAVLMWRATP